MFMDLNDTTIGSALRQLRKERNLKQKFVADQVSISESYINLIENNQKTPSVELTQQLLKLYEVTNLEELDKYNTLLWMTRVPESVKILILKGLQHANGGMNDQGEFAGPPSLKSLYEGKRLPETCPGCGVGDHDEDAAYCIDCGCQLSRCCPKCKKYNKLTVHNCKYCGSALEEILHRGDNVVKFAK
jgi:transcriptional regulator with XRE-family HTH domain